MASPHPRGAASTRVGRERVPPGLRSDPRLLAWSRAAARACGFASLGVGALVLAGWTFGVDALRRLFFASIAMKANAAVCLVLASLSLALSLGGDGARRRRAARALAFAVCAIGVLTLLEFTLGRSLGIDELLSKDTPGFIPPAGRMAPGSAIAFALLGGRLLTLDARTRASVVASQLLAIGAILVAALVVVGYLYGIGSLKGIEPFTPMAFHTAVSLLVLGAGVMLARPEQGLTRLIVSDTSAGVLARRLLPAVAVLPLLVDWLRLEAQRRGWIGLAFGSALLALVHVTVFAALVLYSTRALAHFEGERAEAQRALEDKDAQLAWERGFATTIDSIGDGVITTDTAGRVTRWNRVAEQLTGCAASDAKGRSIRDVLRLVSGDDDGATLPLPFEAVLRGTGAPPQPRSGLLVRTDGERIAVTDTFRPIRAADGELEGVVLVLHDETGAKHEEAARARLQQQLILSDRLAGVGTLAAGVAHEINNPLTFVTTNLELLSEALENAREGSELRVDELAELTHEAQRGAERVRRIVRELKTFSRADEERRVVLDVRSVLEQSIRMTSSAVRHRARLVAELGSVPPVEADEVRLGQVFTNLLVNAAQALPEGRASENEIRVVTRTDGDRAVVEVRDNGGGIPADILGRIFDPFFTTKDVGAGTGLGLSICHGIVRALGGDITVESELGRGSVFRVLLPGARTDATPPASEWRLEVAAPARARVLIVDDEPSLGAALRRVLRGHEVEVVDRAADALLAIRANRPFDVILCDLMMPEMTGMELHARLEREEPALVARMVFVTGGAFTPAAREFLDRVPNHRLEKPVDVRELRALVEGFAVLRDAGPSQPNERAAAPADAGPLAAEPEPDALVADAAFGAAVLEHVVVAVWRGLCTADRLYEFERVLRDVHLRRKRPLLILNVIADRTPLPGSAERDVMRRCFEEMRGRIGPVAIVIEGEGVMVPVKRAGLVAAIAAAGQPFPYKIFRRAHEALAWLVASADDVPPAARILSTLARCEREVASRRER